MLKYSRKLKKNKFRWKTNYQISAPKLRVIAPDGKQIGVLDKQKALEEAKKRGLDLIEIAPFAKPPVARIEDLGKFKYKEEKKLRKQAKKTKSSELKEVRFSPFIGEHDFNTRLERVKEFLGENNKVRLVVVFKGRQMGSKSFGYDLLKKITNDLGDDIAVDMKPKFIGRHLAMVISPIKQSKKVKE